MRIGRLWILCVYGNFYFKPKTLGGDGIYWGWWYFEILKKEVDK